MKIIGSRTAARLVREKLGSRGYVGRLGKEFIVGKKIANAGNLILGLVYGRGNSWGAALTAAGIAIPEDVLKADQVADGQVAE
jgi:hypothetical protein